MKYLVMLSLVVLVLTGCTSKYKADRAVGSAAPRLTKNQASLYVSVPEDGSYAGAGGAGSGAATAKAIVTAFVPYTSRAECGTAREGRDAAMSSAAAGGFSHYIEPTIMNWEDRATEWSGRRDAISVRLIVFDMASRQPIDTVVIHGSSKWATFGGDHPQDLLPEPMSRYAAECFGAVAVKSQPTSGRVKP